MKTTLYTFGVYVCSFVAICALNAGCSPSEINSSEYVVKLDEEIPAILDGGIDVPPSVRENLGINFVSVERRTLASTRRIPGIFELRSDARREYRALLSGRVTIFVTLFQKVEEGDLLLSVNSPRWRQIQHDAVEAEGEITMAEATRDVLRARQDEVNALLAKTTERMDSLKALGTRNAALETTATTLRSSIPRIAAELAAQDAAVSEAHGHYQSRLRILSSVTGLSLQDLLLEVNGEPAWQQITELEIRASGTGTVESLKINDGGWLNEGELVMTTVNPTAIRFHAEAPQSDIALYADGQKALIVPSRGSSVDLQKASAGVLTLGLTAHATERTISLFVSPEGESPDWARAGVSAFLEVQITEGEGEQWAIPLSAVIQDGLEQIFYRRDPENPNKVLRVLADLGENDGRWVAVRSRVKEGDQVVLDGAYALSLSGSAQQAPEGYHYHADGSLHKNH